MSKAYLQPFLIFPDAVLGSMLVTLAGETDATPVYDPNTGSILSQPLGINSVGEVTPFHANDNVLYDLHVFAAGISAVVGNQLYTRENVTVVGGSNGLPGTNGKSVRVQSVTGGAQVYDEFGNTVTVLDGPAGPTGPAGATGATGPAGATGSKGADGIAGYIQLPALPVDPSTVPIGQPVILPDGTMWTNVTGSWTALAVSEAMLDAGLGGKQIVFAGICQHQYLTAVDCEVDCTGVVPVFRIKTVKGGQAISAANPICFYTDGDGTATKHEIDAPVSVEFTYTSGLWGFYFDNTGTLIASQDFATWNDFSRIAVVWRAYINTTRTGQARYETESVEYHRNNVSWSAHEWMHTQGTIHLNGLDSVSNVLAHTAGVPTVSPNADGRNTCISITSGATSDDGLRIDIINSTNALAWNQDLGVLTAGTLTSANAALMEMTYNDVNGLLFMAPATRFPFAWNPVNNYPQYITSTGVFTDVPDNQWMVNFVYSLQDSRNGKQVRLRSATQAFTSFASAKGYSWDSLQAQSLTLRDNEIRPLYRLIHYVNYTVPNVYNVACKYTGLVQIDDIRKSQVQNSTLSSGTVPATNVSVAPIVGLASTNAQAALAELVPVDAVTDGSTKAITSNAVFDALALKQDNESNQTGWSQYTNGTASAVFLNCGHFTISDSSDSSGLAVWEVECFYSGSDGATSMHRSIVTGEMRYTSGAVTRRASALGDFATDSLKWQYDAGGGLAYLTVIAKVPAYGTVRWRRLQGVNAVGYASGGTTITPSGTALSLLSSAPTAPAGSNDKTVANTAWVNTALDRSPKRFYSYSANGTEQHNWLKIGEFNIGTNDGTTRTLGISLTHAGPDFPLAALSSTFTFCYRDGSYHVNKTRMDGSNTAYSVSFRYGLTAFGPGSIQITLWLYSWGSYTRFEGTVTNDRHNMANRIDSPTWIYGTNPQTEDGVVLL